jgi:DeoR/GlpR family transcriptional regulator of sugar metabolism
MFSAQRHERILEYVTARKSAKVSDLSTALRISPSTLRRDVRQLDDQGLIRRVHGGVVRVDERGESPVILRATEYADEKRRIGEAAAQLVQHGDTIIITGGTTTEALLPFLAAKSDITVITNAINVAYHLAEYPRIAVVVLGGWLQHAECYVLGHLTEQAIQDLRATKVFHGVHGLDPEHGLTGTSLQAVQTDRSIIAHAGELIVLADHSKFGRIGPIRMAPTSAASTVVTDSEAPQAIVGELRSQGITVLQA